ncbi:MAG: DNA repair protein RecO [Bacteroidales bacterium]|nr:DNA repair protein RecO [Bacteroidales bacterium]MBN2756722.1 DNA repair protein RecO [Bacteroidales bacterium]
MLEQTRGIFLKQTKYSDSQIIAEIFTEKFGKQAFILRHSSKSKTLPKKNILQPLFLLDLQVYYKQNREIQRIKEISHNPVLSDLPFNISKTSIAIFVSEILYKVIKEEEENSHLFEFLYNSILLLDNIESGIGNYHIIFLYELCKFLGFYPKNNFSSEKKFFNLIEGKFYSIQADSRYYLDEETSKLISILHSKGFSNIENFSFSKNQKKTILDSIIEYYKFHIPNMGKIKSLEILQEIFS